MISRGVEMKGLFVGLICCVVLLVMSFEMLNVIAETGNYNFALMSDSINIVKADTNKETTSKPKTLTIIEVILVTLSALLLGSIIIIMIKRNKRK